MKNKLFGKTLSELEDIIKSYKFPKFTAKQIADWLYKKDIKSIDEMSNLSKKVRVQLNKDYVFGLTDFIKVQKSKDGTKKYLFPIEDNSFIESAYIPEENRATLCVSSQIGCKMGCKFCMTGKQGFQSQLTAGEIVNQIQSLPEKENLTNIVYMGMGEPFDNYDEVLKSTEILTADWGYGMSPKRITVSSIGIISSLKKFLKESNCHLAISLHTPFDNERRNLMPVQNSNPIKAILEIIKEHDFGRQRRISFEYIMFEGINDTKKHVDELAKILDGIKSRINLIKFHAIPESKLKGTSSSKMEEFKTMLDQKGIITTIRKSRGQDIDAACGLLSTKKLLNK